MEHCDSKDRHVEGRYHHDFCFNTIFLIWLKEWLMELLLQNKEVYHYRGSNETQRIRNPNKEKSKGNSKDDEQWEVPG